MSVGHAHCTGAPNLNFAWSRNATVARKQEYTVLTKSNPCYEAVTHAMKRASHVGCNACNARIQRVLLRICYSNVAQFKCASSVHDPRNIRTTFAYFHYFTASSVATLKPAFQSSTYGNYSAQKAVDGDIDPEPKVNTCSLTNYQNNPWWALDLKVTKILASGRSERRNGRKVNFLTIWITFTST
jgi:hypothetical protein